LGETIFSAPDIKEIPQWTSHGFCWSRVVLPLNPMDVRNLNDSELIDMLSEQTTKLTRLISNTLSREEYKKCKLMINALATEIRARKNFKEGETANDRDFLIYE